MSKSMIDESKLAEFGKSVDMQNSILMPDETIENVNSNASRPYGKPIEIPEEVQAKQDEMRAAEIRESMQERERYEMRNAGSTYQVINVADLPTKGLFYPEGTRIMVQAAKLKDIKRWTAMDETNWKDISDKMMDIIESCCVIQYPANYPKSGNWKDIIDVDRLYLVLAIHDMSFAPGVNDIMIKLDEKNDVVLHKDNVKYIEFSDKIMKYYDSEKRCFSFPVKNTRAFEQTGGKMNIYMTNLGVANWIYEYIRECQERRDSYDEDFIAYAALLIKDWRGLTRDKYYDLIEQTQDWGMYEWSLISKIKTILSDQSVTPTLIYKDDRGIEHEAPLNFRDGIKAIFQVSLDIDL